MANQKVGVYEKLFSYAIREFLDKGYKDASLREIARAAGTSTGSIYTRFGDKEGLFRAIVEPTAEEFKRMYLEIQENFHAMDAETQRREMGYYSENEMERLLDYIYAHFDAFRLLLDASYGTLYQNFVNELVDIEVDYTYQYVQAVGMHGATRKKMSHELLHIVVTAYMNGVFEVVRHEMPLADAKRYVRMLGDYHRAGFDTIFAAMERGD